MSNSRVVFLDLETTGLDEYKGYVPWEVGMIEAILDLEEREIRISESTNFDIMLTDEEVANADPMAMRIGGYYRRRDDVGNLYVGQQSVLETGTKDRQVIQRLSAPEAAAFMARRLADAHVVGAVPSFDERFLKPFFFANGHVSTHHYHIIDIEPLMIGRLLALAHDMGSTKFEVDAKGTIKDYKELVGLPYKSRELAWATGITSPVDEAHTAMWDADWAMRCFAAVYDVSIEENLDE